MIIRLIVTHEQIRLPYVVQNCLFWFGIDNYANTTLMTVYLRILMQLTRLKSSPCSMASWIGGLMAMQFSQRRISRQK